jgi:hypothetical protein
MKLNQAGIVLILIVIAALAVSGCMQGIIKPGPSATVTATPGAISTTPTATAAPAGSPAVDFKQVHAFDYGFNTSTGDVPIKGDLKTTYSLVPYGSEGNARRTQTNMTSSTSAGPSVTSVDVYADPTSGNVLGGHIRVEVGGQLLANRDIAAGEQVDKSQTSTPVLTAAQEPGFAKSVKSVGTDQVTVPLGTFSCTKYLLQGQDNNMTYWIASGVPLPIKMVTTDRVTGRDTMTMELISYS